MANATTVNNTGNILVVGVGGTFRTGSSTERAVEKVLGHAESLGAKTLMFGGASLDFPMYRPNVTRDDPHLVKFLDALRSANAVVIGSPGYHGAISGLIKNALDYVEEMSSDEHPYLDGRAVGCVATGSGWQGANATLTSLRSITHALRGWPTPLGLALNTSQPLFDGSGLCLRGEVDQQFRLMATQLVSFCKVSSMIAACDRIRPPVAATHPIHLG